MDASCLCKQRLGNLVTFFRGLISKSADIPFAGRKVCRSVQRILWIRHHPYRLVKNQKGEVDYNQEPGDGRVFLGITTNWSPSSPSSPSQTSTLMPNRPSSRCVWISKIREQRRWPQPSKLRVISFSACSCIPVPIPRPSRTIHHYRTLLVNTPTGLNPFPSELRHDAMKWKSKILKAKLCIVVLNWRARCHTFMLKGSLFMLVPWLISLVRRVLPRTKHSYGEMCN